MGGNQQSKIIERKLEIQLPIHKELSVPIDFNEQSAHYELIIARIRRIFCNVEIVVQGYTPLPGVPGCSPPKWTRTCDGVRINLVALKENQAELEGAYHELYDAIWTPLKQAYESTLSSVKLYKMPDHLKDLTHGENCHVYIAEAESFEAVVARIETHSGQIAWKDPQKKTIRARCPSLAFQTKSEDPLVSFDFFYFCGGDGSIQNYLTGFDFTINAVAQTADGMLIDPYNGCDDSQHKMIRCIGDTKANLRGNPVRLLRALRYQVTLEGRWQLAPELEAALHDEEMVNRLAGVDAKVITFELQKMFITDTPQTLQFLTRYPLLMPVLFQNIEIIVSPKNRLMDNF